jgi:hypothetical protein
VPKDDLPRYVGQAPGSLIKRGPRVALRRCKRRAAAGNTDAERKVCGIRLRAEKRVGELLKDLARATSAERSPGRPKPGQEIAPTTGSISPYAQALTENNISGQTASRYQALAAVPVGDLPRHVGQALRLLVRLGQAWSGGHFQSASAAAIHPTHLIRNRVPGITRPWRPGQSGRGLIFRRARSYPRHLSSVWLLHGFSMYRPSRTH